jgi:C1A family cysteine protease
MAKSIDEKHLKEERENLVTKLTETQKQLELLKNNVQIYVGAIQMTDKLLLNFKEEEKKSETETNTPEPKKSLEEHAKDMVSDIGDDDLGKVKP